MFEQRRAGWLFCQQSLEHFLISSHCQGERKLRCSEILEDYGDKALIIFSLCPILG